ncbi:MAG TPA: hypothetical protein VHU42_03875 [Rhodopila sp.]|jgi:hypothetical protein|nr:hypothetical protein [Rhodopila sp.]
MRAIIVFFGLLLLMRYGALLPIGSTRPGGANIATLTVSILMAGVPLLGIVGIFRILARLPGGFHTQRKSEDIQFRRRDR